MKLIQTSVIQKDQYHFMVFPHGGKLEVKSWEVNAGTPITDPELIDPQCVVVPDRCNQNVEIVFAGEPDHVSFTLPFEAARKLGAILIAETCLEYES